MPLAMVVRECLIFSARPLDGLSNIDDIIATASSAHAAYSGFNILFLDVCAFTLSRRTVKFPDISDDITIEL